MGADPPLTLHRFTRAEYDRMVERGALEDLRVELLDGEIVDVSAQGPQHYEVIAALTEWLGQRIDLLRIQGPLAATEDSEPEPDVALAPRSGPTEHPSTALLAVEVVVSERAAALRKARIYARAGVAIYWIVDVPRRHVVLHEDPTDEGYGRTVVLTGDDELCPPAGLPAKTVDELLADARV